MTDVFAVLFLMDHMTHFSIVLALADKDVISAWQAKWVQLTSAYSHDNNFFSFRQAPLLNMDFNSWHEEGISTFKDLNTKNEGHERHVKLPHQREHNVCFSLLYIAKEN